MKIVLDDMPIEEKLILMEALWENLSKNANNITIPKWHKKIVSKRAMSYKAGKEQAVDWTDAKEKIRTSVK